MAAGRDADLAEVEAFERLEIFRRDVDMRRGLQAGADALFGALQFQGAGDDAAQGANGLPLLPQRRIEPRRRNDGIEPQVNALGLAVWHVVRPREPRLLGGEAGDRRQPRGQEREDLGHDRARRPTAGRAGRVAVDRVLADVEVEGRQVDGAEIMQLRRDRMEIVVVHRAA